jgi:NADH dehydrogenase
VIAGGGFAGLACAVELAKHPDIRLTLIDRNNYQQFQPLLYQVAASSLSAGNAAFALRDVLRDFSNVDIQFDEVVSADLANRSLVTASGRKHAGDVLVLAIGSRVSFFGVPGADQYSFPLYSLIDAERLRSTILRALEEADSNPDSASGVTNFVVVGGGPTGVEMAGALGDMVQRILQREFRNARRDAFQVHLVERSQSILEMFSEASQRYALSALIEKGVQVHRGVAVEAVTPCSVRLSNQLEIPTKTVIWAAGLMPVELRTEPSVDRPRGRIEVRDDLQVVGSPGVYAVGDLANALGPDGKPLPQLAAVAVQAGKHCARNIMRALDGEIPVPFRYSDRGVLAMIGRNAAVAELGHAHHQLTGPMAFAAWLGIHVALLTAVRAKVDAVVEWAWEYFLGEHPEQLIDR